jgi:hypothetical protein
MRIIDSQIALSADTTVTQTITEHATAELWQDRPRIDSVRISAQAKQTAQSPAPADLPEAHRSDSSRPQAEVEAQTDEQLLASPGGARLVILRHLLEKVTGKRISVMQRSDLQAAGMSTSLQPQEQGSGSTPAETPAPNRREGWGARVDVERTHTESSSVEFGAQGTVVTEDGTTFTFDASFLKQSTSTVVESVSLRAGDANLKDPLVLLYSGSSAELTQETTSFDLDANGAVENLPRIANGAYLVDDINRNGRIDDGREVVGALSGNGFADLRAMDEDGNGFIDSGDAKYNDLRLWQPNLPEAGQLATLADINVLGLYVGDVSSPLPIQQANGQVVGRVRASGIYVSSNGDVKPMEQIDVKA